MERKLIEKQQMLKSQVTRVFLVLISYLFVGCTEETQTCIVLPEGETVNTSSVKDFEMHYSLTFMAYQGFVGNIEGKLLNGFTLILEDHAAKIGRDVLSSNEVESLKSDKILSIKSDKIPVTREPYQMVVDYIAKSYPNLHKKIAVDKEAGVDDETNFLNNKGEVIVVVQYVELGIPGTFIILNNHTCNR